MSGLEIGLISVVAIILLIYAGVYVPVALGLVSFAGVWFMRDNFDVARQLLVLAATDSIVEYTFSVIPLFVLMGLLVSVSDLGKDSYEVAHQIFRRVRGGLGIATVVANAIFAAITGVSIASLAVFTRVSVPEMLRFGYSPRFAVGVVAGSSVLGMLIPPSVLLIIYALITEQSVGAMFIAGIVPGIILTLAYCAMIVAMTYVAPSYVGAPTGKPGAKSTSPATLGEVGRLMGPQEITLKMFPVLLLIVIVLGGIYGGIFTPTEAGAAGALATLVIATFKRSFGGAGFWRVVVETGQISSSILFLVISATMYSRMLGVSGLPTQLGNWITSLDTNFTIVIVIYVSVLLILGTILDSISIILVTVPLFLPVVAPFSVDLVWFGIVTIIAVEIGLLTPPLGIACYVIKSTLEDEGISLADIFIGAAPFAIVMLLVLMLIIAEPQLSTFLVYL